MISTGYSEKNISEIQNVRDVLSLHQVKNEIIDEILGKANDGRSNFANL